jgi:hypothetical protein
MNDGPPLRSTIGYCRPPTMAMMAKRVVAQVQRHAGCAVAVARMPAGHGYAVRTADGVAMGGTTFRGGFGCGWSVQECDTNDGAESNYDQDDGHARRDASADARRDRRLVIHRGSRTPRPRP